MKIEYFDSAWDAVEPSKAEVAQLKGASDLNWWDIILPCPQPQKKSALPSLPP
jgi:hypothetical protein